MLAKRIISCLDVKNGKTVKGVNFVDIVELGDPIEMGKHYAKAGADELVFLDITATLDKRKTMTKWVKEVAENINIPFTVGGGVASVEDFDVLLNHGADKISVNSAAVRHPNLITDAADRFGAQCVVVAIDTKFVDGEWKVFLNGGSLATDINTLDWAKEIENRGAGEILLTSMNNDGTKEGFAIDITKKVSDLVSIPVIASGGAGKVEDFLDVFQNTNAEAALAAGIFHRNEISIQEVKDFLKSHHLNIR